MHFLSYAARQRLKKALLWLGILLAAGLIFCIGRFVYLERFVVYDEGGVHLDYSGNVTEHQEETARPSGEFILQEESAVSESIDAPVQGQISRLSGMYFTAAQLTDPVLTAQLPQLLEEHSAVMLDVKTATGKFLYATSLPGTERHKTDLSGLIGILSQRSGLTLIARLPAFQDSAHALTDFSQSLPIRGGALWMDKNGSYCLDPAGEDVPGYLVSQAQELYSLGFDEVVFAGFDFPESRNIHYQREISGQEAALSAAQNIAAQLETLSIPVSFQSKDAQILSLSHRAFIPAETGDLISTLAREYSLLLPGSDTRLVFLTRSRDTRFESYSVLSPYTEAQD